MKLAAYNVFILTVACLVVGSVVARGAEPGTNSQDTAKEVGTEEVGDQSRCVETDRIVKYTVESDATVRLHMRYSRQMLLHLKRSCPQLYFHSYMSYTPVDGRICAGVDDIKTRSGVTCRIESLVPVPEEAKTGPVPQVDVQ